MASSRKRPRDLVSPAGDPQHLSTPAAEGTGSQFFTTVEGSYSSQRTLECEVPVLHQSMYLSNMVEGRPISSRQRTSVVFESGCDMQETFYVGNIMMRLNGRLDMATLFREGKSFQLSLVLEVGSHSKEDSSQREEDESHREEGGLHREEDGLQREEDGSQREEDGSHREEDGAYREEDGNQWLLKLVLGETVQYLQVKMDPRFTGIPSHLVGVMWRKISSHMKLFLAQSAKNCVLEQSLVLEVWALNALCHSGYPYELGTPLTNQMVYTLLVQTLYPDVVGPYYDKG